MDRLFYIFYKDRTESHSRYYGTFEGEGFADRVIHELETHGKLDVHKTEVWLSSHIKYYKEHPEEVVMG